MAYQINLTGQEIDERLQNVGTAEDVAAADGTLYARINKNADDIAENKENVKNLIKRVDVVTGTANGAEALAKVNEERINTVTGKANTALELAQKNQFNLGHVQATANTALKNSEINQDRVRNAQITANEAKASVEGLTTVVRRAENDISQLKELNVVYPNNIRNLTTESTEAEIMEAFIPAINGSAGVVNTPHVGYLIKGNRNSDDNGYDPDSTIISVEVVKIDNHDCHKFMYIDNNRDLVTMTVCIWGGTFKVIERSVVSNIDTIIDKTPYTFDGRLCVLEKGDNISECLIPENMSQSITPRVGDNIRLNRYYDTPSENPSWAIITGVQQSGNKIMVSASSVDTTFRFSYNATTYEVVTPWTEIHGSKNIYNTDLLLSLNTTATDEATIKKALTPKGCDYPVMPISGDIAESTDSFNSVIITIDSEDESLIFLPTPYYNNLIYAISVRKDYTSTEKKPITMRTYRVCYDGQALSDNSVKDPSIIKDLYTPFSEVDGTPDIDGQRAPRVGDLINMGDGNMGVVSEAIVKDNTYITRWFYGGKLYEVAVSKDFTSIPEYRKVIYDTTSGTLRDLYISAGAKYNEATGYYELNGLTDITEEQMRVIYEKTWGWWLHLPSLNGFGSALPRTNIPCPDYKIIAYASKISIHSIFAVSGNDDNLEVVNLRALYTPTIFDEIKIVDFNWAFQEDKNLREVQGIINVKEARSDLNIGGNIETINIKGLKVNIRFYNSQRLSKESVLYMINNSEATKAITIGLNKAVYDVMKDDADIIAALAEKTNITLVQNT